ncbi:OLIGOPEPTIDE TRANSPORTER-RELATED [Salix purpurea]|uniref:OLIGOPEPTIDE TRANSPORTER-RELATED n=1 Tax=Salix purpurea TaxID=77065 RepID=A0A9Q0VW21_SALPP|nr:OLIGOPEPTIDE TRANSPORTER-RELATED [Salix purpurea]
MFVTVNNVANWSGTCYVIPLLGAFLADADLGRYWTIAGFSIIYVVGMTLLTLPIPSSSGDWRDQAFSGDVILWGSTPSDRGISFLARQLWRLHQTVLRRLHFETVTDLSTSHGNPGWIPDSLNHGRLHYFLWLLAVLSVLNLGVYLLVARWYTYKKALASVIDIYCRILGDIP